MFRITASVLIIITAVLLQSCSEPAIKNYPPKNRKIACLGDSLVSGVGASAGENYPAQLSRMIKLPVANFGKSGDTATNALGRLDKLIAGDFGIIIVTLGGNEFMRREK